MTTATVVERYGRPLFRESLLISIPLKRRHEEKDTPKVRIVPGPECEDYDFVSRAFS
jgi:hypothetical protein